jgi:hypothetical protein
MDWVERLLHINPDRGSGLFEAAILVLAVAAVFWRPIMARISRRLRHRW